MEMPKLQFFNFIFFFFFYLLTSRIHCTSLICENRRVLEGTALYILWAYNEYNETIPGSARAILSYAEGFKPALSRTWMSVLPDVNTMYHEETLHLA